MCRNGGYTERGIKERHGYGAERFRIEPEFVVKVDPALDILGVLLEPASILAKAWDHTERIGQRARGWQPRSLLVTGAGPIGLLAALMGKQRGLDVHVLDHNKGGPKEAIVHDLGGDLSYRREHPRTPRSRRPDGMHRRRHRRSVHCLGAGAPGGIVCLTGVTEPGTDFRPRHRPSQPQDGARQRDCVRHASTPTAAITRWRRRRWRAPTSAGSTRLITRRVAARELAARRSSRARTTSRSSSILPNRPSCRSPSRTTP